MKKIAISSLLLLLAACGQSSDQPKPDQFPGFAQIGTDNQTSRLFVDFDSVKRDANGNVTFKQLRVLDAGYAIHDAETDCRDTYKGLAGTKFTKDGVGESDYPADTMFIAYSDQPTLSALVNKVCEKVNESRMITGAFDDIKALELVYGPYHPELKSAYWTNIRPPASLSQSASDFTGKNGIVKIVFSEEYKEGKDTKRILFTQTQLADGGGDCHPCGSLLGAITFVRVGNKWRIESDNRYLEIMGKWGGPPELSWVNLGKNTHGILVKMTDTHHGVTSGFIGIYKLGIGGWEQILESLDESETISDLHLKLDNSNSDQNYAEATVSVEFDDEGKKSVIEKKYSFDGYRYHLISRTENRTKDNQRSLSTAIAFEEKNVGTTMRAIDTDPAILVEKTRPNATPPFASPTPEASTLPDSAAPPMPYDDPGACPFECCMYREWTVKEYAIISTEMRKNSPVAFEVSKGETVEGLTGVVLVNKPGQAKILEPATIGTRKIKRGDEIYLLTYLGEGDYTGWVQGRVLKSLNGAGIVWETISEPEYDWWVKVQNKEGQVGWTMQADHFGNIDACGDSESDKPTALSTPERRFGSGTLKVGDNLVSYWHSSQSEAVAEFQFDTKGYRNTYNLDCQKSQFRWTSNILISNGQETGNNSSAEWKPLNPSSTSANAVFQAICPKLLAKVGAPAPRPESIIDVSRSSRAGAAGDTFWDHNGSLMRLRASGNNRSFEYEVPSLRMKEAGVEKGSLLFEGVRKGSRYVGTAKVFSKNCGEPREYAVEGQVVTDQRVVLKGRREVFGAGCTPSGRYKEDTLEFVLK